MFSKSARWSPPYLGRFVLATPDSGPSCVVYLLAMRHGVWSMSLYLAFGHMEKQARRVLCGKDEYAKLAPFKPRPRREQHSA